MLGDMALASWKDVLKTKLPWQDKGLFNAHMRQRLYNDETESLNREGNRRVKCPSMCLLRSSFHLWREEA